MEPFRRNTGTVARNQERMSGRGKKILAVTALLAVPLVFYEGVSWSVFLLAYRIWGMAAADHTLEVMTAAAALACLVLGAGYWRLVRPWTWKQRAERGKKPLVLWLLLVPVAAVSCVGLNILVAMLSLDTSAYARMNETLYQSSFAVQAVSTVLVIPLAEELVFRGFAFSVLRERMPFWAAALASAAYFGIFHGNLPQGIYAFLIGLELACCCEWYGGLGAAWLFHGLVNLTSVVMMNL